jgi:hypothetical protein
MRPRQFPRMNQTFRVLDNPTILLRGFFNEPPQDVRYSNNPARTLQTPVGTDYKSLIGKMIISCTRIPSRHILGEFMSQEDCYLFRSYEASDCLVLKRSIQEINPVTKQARSAVLIDMGEIWVSVSNEDARISAVTTNPNNEFSIRSAVRLMNGDILGPYLVKTAVIENGIWLAKADYNVSKF